MEGEGGGGAVGEVGDGHSRGGSAVFVQEDHVRKSRSFGRGEQVREDEVPPVEADGGWEEQSDLLAEGGEAGGGAAGGGDEGPGVSEA